MAASSARRRATGLVGIALLSACAARGPTYSEVVGDAGTVAADRARVVFLRPRDRDDGGGAPATIFVGGTRVGALRYGGAFHVDTTPGVISVAASGRFRAFGVCEIDIEVPAGATAYIDAGPRLSYMIAAAVGGVVGGAAGAAAVPDAYGSAGEAVATIGAAVGAGSAAGTAAAVGVEGRDRPCRGPIRLTPVSEATALPRASALVWSR